MILSKPPALPKPFIVSNKSDDKYFFLGKAYTFYPFITLNSKSLISSIISKEVLLD